MSSATNAREFMIRRLAAELSGPMQEVLMNGFYNEGSSTIIRPKNNPTRKALVRRGLVHDGDNRWTALGREVAQHLGEPWNSRAVKSIDELHAMAVAEDWVRTGKTVKVVGVGGATNVRHGVVVDVTEGGRSVHVRVSDGHVVVADSLNVEVVPAEPLPICLRVDGLHVGHMVAVSTDCRDEQQDLISDQAEGTCTAAYGWTLPHAFEYDMAGVKQAIAGNDGYDEFERCGKAPNDPVHEQPTQLTDATGLTLIDHVDDRTGASVGMWRGVDAAPVEWGQHFTEQPTEPRPAHFGSDYLLPVCEVANEDPTTVVFTPPAPADLNDDDAWQRYVASTPTPTPDEYAAVIAEFGVSPYADRIHECAQHFRAVARELWAARREGTLTDGLYRELRGSMRVARECIAVYRRLTAAWARRAADELATA